MSKKVAEKKIISTENAEPSKKDIKKAKKSKAKAEKLDKRNHKKIEKLAKKISKKDKISLDDARDIAEPMILAPIIEEEVPEEKDHAPKSLSETIAICIAIVLCVAMVMFTISYSFGKVTDAKFSAATQPAVEDTVQA